MKIGVIGTGYVGLVQGVILSQFGLNVICVDNNEKKIEALNAGEVPIYEPGLEDLLRKNIKEKRIEFTTDIAYAIKESEVLFIAVGTPPAEDGSADLTYVSEVASSIGDNLNGFKVIVNKSTVPVGTGKLVSDIISKRLEEREVDIDFEVVSNPEFLREGKAVNDCLRPDRVVIGTESEKAREIMKKVYNVLYINETPFVFTNIETAEMIKYASNAFLAVKISFINEMALLSEKVGADIQKIAKAMGQDGRISPKFLHAGPGYGGSCFPKDTKAIADIGKKLGIRQLIVEAAIDANENQKKKMVEKITDNMGDVKGKTIAILGLSFKPDTDDVRDAPSLEIIQGLVKKGAIIRAYCPQGMKESKWRLEEYKDSIKYCKDEYEAVTGADAVAVVTEWNQFRGMNATKVRSLMKDNYLFDLRNIYGKNPEIRKLFKYHAVGRK